MSEQLPHSIFEFGPFQLDTLQRLLRSTDGRLVPLSPRVFDTLLYFVRHPGRPIGKAALMEAIWPRVVVEEGSLSQAIYELRRALGERPDDHRYIVTLPNRGYQFVADVVERERAAPESGVSDDDATRASKPTGPSPIDVSPPDRAAASAIEGLPIAARTLLKSPDRMQTRYVVAGAVLVASAFAAWYYDRSVGDTFAVHDEIASSILAAQNVALAGAPSVKSSSTDPRAYEHFLLAHYFFSRRQNGDLVRAERAYRSALELDPAFARAWAGLAGVYYVASDRFDILGLSREQALERLREAAEKALALDPNLAEAHVRRAMHRVETGDRAGARAQLQRAVALEPNDPLILGWLAGDALLEGRPSEAIDLQRRAVLHDPLRVATRANLGTFLFFSGNYDQATVELRTALQLAGTLNGSWDSPENVLRDAAVSLAKTLIAQRQFDEALGLILPWPEGQYRDQCLALLYHALGNQRDADAALARLVASATTDAHWIAETYAQRGNNDQAFRWIATAAERSRSSRDLAQLWRLDIRYSPFAASLHQDPRWTAWLAEKR